MILSPEMKMNMAQFLTQMSRTGDLAQVTPFSSKANKPSLPTSALQLTLWFSSERE